MNRIGWEHSQEITEMIGALERRGLDIVKAFDVREYNTLIADHPRLQEIPTFGSAGSLALLVGNTKVIWPLFIRDLQARGALDTSDPLDRYVTEVIAEAAGKLAMDHLIRWGHLGGKDLVSMIHLAEASGLAERSPAHLAVHPVYGPWFALRAVIVLDTPSPPRESPGPVLSADWAALCLEAFEAACQREGATWHDWVAVRDACPLGRSYRYGPSQLRYHYTKDKAALVLDPDIGPEAV